MLINAFAELLINVWEMDFSLIWGSFFNSEAL